ncbi:hypothetical protein ABPG75_013558 [Micractinium tetrahymenae]
MLHLCSLQHGLGAGLQQLRADGRLLSGRACQSVLQTLRRSLAAAPPPPPPGRRPAADRQALHACACTGRQQQGIVDNAAQQRQLQHEEAAARDDGSAAGAAATGAAGEPQPLCSTTTALGQVMAAQANFVRVKVDSLEGAAPGEAPPRPRLLCVVRALLKKIKQEVLVGDRVRVVGIDWADGRGMVEEVLPRSSQLSEPAVANVDHVLLVFSAATPAFQPSPATRYLLSAEAAWLPVTVAINKADLLPAEEVQAVVDQVASWGYDAVAVSVLSGEGLDSLTEALRGRVTVVAGPSGAGKSSIINALRLRSLGLESALGALDTAGAGAGAGSEEEDEEEELEGPEEGGYGCSQGHSEAAAAAAGEDQQQQRRPQNGAAPAPPGPQHAEQQGSNGSLAGQRQRQQPGDRGSSHAGGSSSSPGSAGDASATALLADLGLQAVGSVSQRIGRGRHTTRNVTLLELEGSGGGLVVDTPGFNQPTLGMPAAELGQHFPEVRRLLEQDRCAFRGCQHLAEPGCVVREAGWERYPLYAEIHGELKAQEEVAAQRQASKKRREGSVRLKSRAGGQYGVEARLETKAHRRVSRRSVKQKLSELVRDVEEDNAF